MREGLRVEVEPRLDRSPLALDLGHHLHVRNLAPLNRAVLFDHLPALGDQLVPRDAVAQPDEQLADAPLFEELAVSFGFLRSSLPIVGWGSAERL